MKYLYSSLFYNLYADRQKPTDCSVHFYIIMQFVCNTIVLILINTFSLLLAYEFMSWLFRCSIVLYRIGTTYVQYVHYAAEMC